MKTELIEKYRAFVKWILTRDHEIADYSQRGKDHLKGIDELEAQIRANESTPVTDDDIKAFAKTEIDPGMTETPSIELRRRMYCYGAKDMRDGKIKSQSNNEKLFDIEHRKASHNRPNLITSTFQQKSQPVTMTDEIKEAIEFITENPDQDDYVNGRQSIQEAIPDDYDPVKSAYSGALTGKEPSLYNQQIVNEATELAIKKAGKSQPKAKADDVEIKDVELIAEKLTKNHPDFATEGMSEYMNGYYNGIIKGIKYASQFPWIETNAGKIKTAEEILDNVFKECNVKNVSDRFKSCIIFAIEEYHNQFPQIDLRAELIKLAKHLTSKDFPYSVLHGEKYPFATAKENFSPEQIVDKYLAVLFAEELLPCPFCGGGAILKDHGIGKGGYMINCSNRCGVIMTGEGRNGNRGREKEIHEEIRIAVIKNWNLRQRQKPTHDK